MYKNGGHFWPPFLFCILYLYYLEKSLKKIIFIVFVLCSVKSSSQEAFSIGTDVGLLRNFSKGHKFWTVGQSIIATVHFTPRHSAYTWFKYYIPGKFSNNFTATARDAATTPQQINYSVKANWAFREFSIGYKGYLAGSYDAETGYNVYALAGLGLMFARAENISDLDTSQYAPVPKPVTGSNSFNRLTLDLGIGGEVPIGGNIYIYSDLRTWVNMSSYPSNVFHNEEEATLPVMLHVGIRMLFNYW